MTRPFDRFAVLSVLVALGVAWPVLDLLGRNAEFFLARRAPRLDILAVVLALALALPILVGLLGLLPGRWGRVVAYPSAALLTALLAFLALRRLPLLEWVELALALVAGGLATVLLHRLEPARMLFRFLSPVPVVLVALFVLATPTGGVLADRGVTVGTPVTPANPAPVVVVVFDEFPVASLIDPEGRLRADRYPSFARLAADGAWFRNAVTVQQQTEHSVPAILTGFSPDQDRTPYAGQYPNSLFTALSDSHETVIMETITHLCPFTVCEAEAPPSPPADRARALARDIGVVAGHVLLPASVGETLPPIDQSWGDFGAASAEFDVVAEFREEFEADPRKPVHAFIDAIRPAGGSPPFLFLHAVIPHHPWQFLPDGTRYPLTVERAPGSKSPGWGSDEWLIAQALQRHLLQVQYADHALGLMLDALEDAGLYDEAVVIVTADHGIAVKPNVEHQRGITPETIGEVAAVPLFVKAPGQPGGVVDDRRAHTTDIVPTIADALGFEVPWRVDGSSLLGPPPARDRTTTVGPEGPVTYGVEGGEKLEVAARLATWFPTGDPWELVPPGVSRRLLGREVGSSQGSATYSARLDRPSWYADVRPESGVVPARVSGRLVGAAGGDRVLGVVVNGVMGAVTRTYLEDGVVRFQAMVPPDLFEEGRNEIGVVDIGPAGMVAVDVI